MEIISNGLLCLHNQVTLQGPKDSLDGGSRGSAVMDMPIQLWEELRFTLVCYPIHSQNERIPQGMAMIDPVAAHGFQKGTSQPLIEGRPRPDVEVEFGGFGSPGSFVPCRSRQDSWKGKSGGREGGRGVLSLDGLGIGSQSSGGREGGQAAELPGVSLGARGGVGGRGRSLDADRRNCQC